MSIIITETRRGSAMPRTAYRCNDADDFIGRIRETQLQHRSGDELVETLEQAVEWLDETFGIETRIIEQADYVEGEFGPLVDDLADKLGWRDEK